MLPKFTPKVGDYVSHKHERFKDAVFRIELIEEITSCKGDAVIVQALMFDYGKDTHTLSGAKNSFTFVDKKESELFSLAF